MTAAEKEFCDSWVSSHARKWQVLNRAQWNYQFRGKAMVRYVEEVQMRESEVRILLEYLSSNDCIATLSTYDQQISGEWRPIKAWYEASNKSAGNVRGVRLYHGLRTDVVDGEDGPYVLEKGCAYSISITYFWDVDSVREVPESTSGISYRITGINRDQETGRYTYAVEKRERVQQDIGEYLVSTTILADRSEESHIGVKLEDRDTTGQMPSVGGGKTVMRKLSKNPDCTWDIGNEIRQDKPVSGISVSTSEAAAGTRVTTESVNMPSPASTDGLAPGESVKNERTASGLWNTVVSKFRPVFEKISERCRKTAFGHLHSFVRNVREKPDFDHVREAGGGKIVDKSVSRSENGYRVEETETTETPVRDAVVSKSMTLYGLEERRTHRSQSADVPEPTEIGSSVEVRKTEGGLLDVTEAKSGRRPAGKIAESCQRDYYSHGHSETKNELELAEEDVEFTPGRVKSVSGSRNSNGTANNTTKTVTAERRENAYQYTRADGSVCHVVEYYNWPVRYANYPVGADGLSIRDHVNDFGLHDGSVSWFTNVRYVERRSIKAIKHGAKIEMYEVARDRKHHRWVHRRMYVQLVRKIGFLELEFEDEQLHANPYAVENTQVMWVKKRAEYSENGERLADWDAVVFVGFDGDANNWTPCDKNCRDKHAFAVTAPKEIRENMHRLIASTGDDRNDNSHWDKLINCLEKMPERNAASFFVEQLKPHFAEPERPKEGEKK